MHARKRSNKKRLWDRHPEDWYIEPDWCDDRLFAAEKFEGRIHDPACGSGRIIAAARRAGLRATGSDIVKRAPSFRVGNFFEQTRFVENVVSNVPFRFAMAFVGHALNLADRKVAILLPSAWINAEARSIWLSRTPLRQIWLLAPRPSMPPGHRANEPRVGNGTTDFAWLVWERGYVEKPRIGWLRRGDTDPSPISVPAPGFAAHLLKEPA
ncbi:hypothetical protein [Bradyrhizobium sp.]|uniref:hypothetical protein n=1 Tax=Bradyrhizobium sp. TaxID=376 RepID=UPI0039E379AC